MECAKPTSKREIKLVAFYMYTVAKSKDDSTNNCIFDVIDIDGNATEIYNGVVENPSRKDKPLDGGMFFKR